MITEQQIRLLKSYQDKSYISAILCEKSYSYFSFLKNLFNFPIILASSAMSILNSSQIEQEQLKYINIIVNAMTALILSLVSSFKFNEKATNFKSQSLKFNKLVHQIEDSLINQPDDINTDMIRNFITNYDNIYENIDYSFPYHIREQVKNTYKNERVLPNAINCVKGSLLTPSNTPALQPLKSSNTSQIVIPLNQDIQQADPSL